MISTAANGSIMKGVRSSLQDQMPMEEIAKSFNAFIGHPSEALIHRALVAADATSAWHQGFPAISTQANAIKRPPPVAMRLETKPHSAQSVSP